MAASQAITPKHKGKWTIKADRWPWQDGYNWHGAEKYAPLNAKLPGEKAAPRFGGGWQWCLGFRSGAPSKYGWTLLLDLLFGTVRINYQSAYSVQQDAERAARRAEAISNIEVPF